MFYDIFISLCEKIGKKPGRVAEEIGINRATITQWKNKPDIIPNLKIQQKVADYFNVSLDFLSGRDDTKKGPPSGEPREQPDEEDFRYALSGELKDLTDEEFQEIMNYIKFVEQKRRIK